jgi:predicted peptidase
MVIKNKKNNSNSILNFEIHKNIMKKQLLSLCILLTICFMTQAQNALFQKKEFILKGDTLRYRVLFPENYDKKKSYPLVLFLHGSGERGNDNEKQLVHGASLFTDSLNRKNFPAIVLFPQCPDKQGWVNFKDKTHEKFTFDVSKDPAKPLYLANKLVDFYIKTESINNKRIYVLGLSLGGMGTFDLICRYPNKFAAAIPICGGVDVERLKKVSKLPIRIFNGDIDKSVSPEYSRNAYNELKANGSHQVEHIEYPGIGHDSWTPAFAEPDFLKWLFSHKK